MSDDVLDVPPVCLDEDVCRLLRISPKALQRKRRAGTFPIPELESFDRKHRYSGRDLIAFINREVPQTSRRGSTPPTKRNAPTRWHSRGAQSTIGANNDRPSEDTTTAH